MICLFGKSSSRIISVLREQHRNRIATGWNRSPAQVGCVRQLLQAGALGRPRGIGWRGRWEGGSGWGILVNPWLIHVNVWQKPIQYCKVISLQLIKINEKKELFQRWKYRKDTKKGIKQLKKLGTQWELKIRGIRAESLEWNDVETLQVNKEMWISFSVPSKNKTS